MPKKTFLMEEFHLSVFAPGGLPKTEYDAIRRALHDQRLKTRLRNAMREVFRHRSALKKTQIRISR
jgi:hypothetical protein